MDNFLDWLFDEFDHGFAMNAPLYLPAGSMIDLSSDCGYESYYLPSEFHREERK